MAPKTYKQAKDKKDRLTKEQAQREKQTKREIAKAQAKKRRIAKQREKEVELGRGFLSQITPRKFYKFHSDYFRIDDGFATILTLFNKDGSDDNLPPMWGINLIPRNLGDGVITRLIMQTNVAEQKWVDSKQASADSRTDAEVAEVDRSNSTKNALSIQKKKRDLVTIAEDLSDGDSYMYVAIKVLIKAPTLEILDTAVDRLKREYDNNFGAVYVAPFEGRQRDDLANLYRSAEEQLGRNYMFTASEYAGSYNLVTHGIEDPGGTYVGQMRADVNNAAVLFDVDNYDSHVVIGTENRASTLSYPREFGSIKSSTLFAELLSQRALLNNHRVIHFVMNGADVSGENSVGVDLSDITSNISMNSGDINPFEMFGEFKDELRIYPAHVAKIVLMVEQIDPTLDSSTLIKLERELNEFYIRQRMWVRDSARFRDELRIVGLAHTEYPRLRDFIMYLDSSYEAYASGEHHDEQVLSSLRHLKDLFWSLLESNGDLFDTITSNGVDSASVSPRVVYNFSSLRERGNGIAMAQFVNALGFATRQLVDGDLVIIHGVDQLDKSIIEYTRDCIDQLYGKHVRVAFLYDNIDAMLDDVKLNQMPKADWILTGYMSTPTVNKYQEVLSATIPETLASAVKTKNHTQYYLRRGVDNIIFDADLILA